MFEETDEFGIIFSAWVSVAGCIFWTLFWMLLHKVLPPRDLDRWNSGDETLENNGSRLQSFYVRKLKRMIIYCSVASMAGLLFFMSCFFSPQPTKSMLTSFGPAQQFFFWMAVGHWTAALWEDWHTQEFLGQGLTVESGGGLALFPLNLCCTSAQVMYATYTVHHLVTIFAYVYSLWSQELGGVMVQGLLFELPVVFMLRRELGHQAAENRKPPGWLQKPRRARTLWWSTYLAFLLGRGPAECLWIISMIPTAYGYELLAESLSLPSIVVYHTLAVFFTSLNLRIIGLLFCWHEQDVAWAKRFEQELRNADQSSSKEISKE